jgi:phage N-6-adenine-methyltransferase
MGRLANPYLGLVMKASDQSSKSKQDYGTPFSFLSAVQTRLHIDDFSWDLAADDDNTVCGGYYDIADNSLIQDWHKIDGWLWLNPPFADIYPWARKCYEESQMGAHIALLVPLSIAEWWTDYVDQKGYALLLHGRLTFVGETKPYPKDCALVLYGPEGMKGYEVWDWKA